MTAAAAEAGGAVARAAQRAGRRRLISTLLIWLPLVWLALVLCAGMLAEELPLADPAAQDLAEILAPPGAEHLFGADSLGRDLLARSLFGLRISIVVGISSVAIGLLFGGTLGLLAGYYRGRLETTIMALTNVVLAFPPLVLAIAITSSAGPPLLKVILAIGVLFVPAFTRIARANTLIFADKEFVLAARAVGMRDRHVLIGEILPNLVTPLLVYSLLMVAVAIVGEASLSFLGLSVPPPAPSLGGMIAAEQSNVLDAPFAVFFPAGMLFLTVFALNLVGDQVQRRLDVREQML
jgi:peptide/nickel transport system permease protein